MAAILMFAPNPNRGMDIDRVVVVGKSAEQNRLSVLSVSAVENDFPLFRASRLRHRRDTVLPFLASAIALLGGVELAVAWHWWSLVVGLVLAVAIVKATHRRLIDAAAEFVAMDGETMMRLRASSAVWEVPAHLVVPESIGVYPEHLTNWSPIEAQPK